MSHEKPNSKLRLAVVRYAVCDCKDWVRRHWKVSVGLPVFLFATGAVAHATRDGISPVREEWHVFALYTLGPLAILLLIAVMWKFYDASFKMLASSVSRYKLMVEQNESTVMSLQERVEELESEVASLRNEEERRAARSKALRVLRETLPLVELMIAECDRATCDEANAKLLLERANRILNQATSAVSGTEWRDVIEENWSDFRNLGKREWAALGSLNLLSALHGSFGDDRIFYPEGKIKEIRSDLQKLRSRIEGVLEGERPARG